MQAGASAAVARRWRRPWLRPPCAWMSSSSCRTHSRTCHGQPSCATPDAVGRRSPGGPAPVVALETVDLAAIAPMLQRLIETWAAPTYL
ncbi:MAG: hypothetical protein HZY76_11690 [Anaerolineae bacterium]|nr:MAG: hypothetical protein HZY76_11690 [Anaerolineae bacterium]